MASSVSISKDNRKFLVYKHTNKINNKVYIGITSKSPNNRWQKGKGYVGCDRFLKAINKYGWDNFTHEILKEGLSEEEAELLEEKLISEYDSTNPDKGYNLKASSIKGHPQFTEETKKKISEKASQRRWTEEQRKMLSEAHKGKSPSNKGIKYSGEIRKRFSEAHKGIKYPNRKSPGRFSEEHRKHISEGNKGKHKGPLSDETRQKISEKNRGHICTEEHKLKISIEAEKRHSIYLKLKEEGKASIFNNYNAFQHWYKLNKNNIEEALNSL